MIYINDQSHVLERTVTLNGLFLDLKMEIGKGVAVALNNKVVPRADWSACMISDGDRLILIKATQGG